MGADVNVGARITVDTGNSETALTGVTTGLNNTGAAARAANEQVQEVGGGFGALKEKLSALPGPAGEAVEGVGKLDKVFKLLIANPIILVISGIVLVLAGLYKAFSSTFEGGQKVEQVFEGIKAAAQVVIDRVVLFSGAIIKFFSGDFKGAMADAKASVTGVGDEIEKTYTKTAALTKRLQELAIIQRKDDEDKHKRAADLAELKESINDDTIPIKQRIENAKKLRAEEDVNAKEDLKNNQEYTDLRIAQLTQETDGERKNAQEITDLRNKLADSKTENLNEERATNKVIRNLQKQEAAEDKAAEDEVIKRRKEAEKTRVADAKNTAKVISELRKESAKESKDLADYGIKLEKAQKEADDAAAKAKMASEKAVTDFALQYADAVAKKKEEDTARSKELAKNEADARVQSAMIISNALTSLGELVGQQTLLGKGFAVASAIINTYLGYTKAISQGGLYGAIAGVAVIAAGLNTVRKIVSTQVPGATGSAGGSASVSAPAAPIAPQAQTTTLDQGSINQIGNAANPARAFVVDSDIQNNRERITRINRAARIG